MNLDLKLNPLVCEFFSPVDLDAISQLDRDQAQFYFNFRSGDLWARRLLCDLCEVAPTARGVLALYGAMKYLENRAQYVSQDWTAEVFGVQVQVARGNCHGRRRRVGGLA